MQSGSNLGTEYVYVDQGETPQKVKHPSHLEHPEQLLSVAALLGCPGVARRQVLLQQGQAVGVAGLQVQRRAQLVVEQLRVPAASKHTRVSSVFHLSKMQGMMMMIMISLRATRGRRL